MFLADTVVDWVIERRPQDQADGEVVATLRRKNPGELRAQLFKWRGRLA